MGGGTRPHRRPGYCRSGWRDLCVSASGIGWRGYAPTAPAPGLTPVPPYLVPRGKEQVVSKATDISLHGLPIAAQ